MSAGLAILIIGIIVALVVDGALGVVLIVVGLLLAIFGR